MTRTGAATLAVLAVLALALGSCGRGSGTLVLRVRLAPDDAGGWAAVECDTDWAGAGRGPLRDEGWRRVAEVTPTLRLAATGESVEAARGELPAGRYDRVFVALPGARASDRAGRVSELRSHVEPIARGFELRGGEVVAVEIDLVVMPPSSNGDGRPELFVRDARLVRVAHVAPMAREAGGHMDDSTRFENAIRQYFSAAGGADADAFADLFAADAAIEDPIGTPVLAGREGALRFHRGMHRTWSRIALDAQEVYVRGDRAAARWTAVGTGQSGRELRFAGIDTFRFDADGRIAVLVGYWDLESVIERLRADAAS